MLKIFGQFVQLLPVMSPVFASIKILVREENIARITKRCPENITLAVKFVKLLLPNVKRKKKRKKLQL